jgi:hypothetical protein
LTVFLINRITESALQRATYLEHQRGQPREIATPMALVTPALTKDAVARPAKATAATSAAPVAALAAPAPVSPAPAWLERVNYWRALAKVPPVTEDFGLLPGLTAHARYLVMNRKALAVGAAMHTEDPELPGFSQEGLVAGQHPPGAVIPPSLPTSAVSNIDTWIAIPLHRTAILDPNLMRIALGRYCENGVCAAALSGDVQQSWKASELEQFPNPVEFPPDGTTLPHAFRMFGGEWPNPLSSCPGYGPLTGEPISLQFDNRFIPKLTAFTVTRNGTAVETCGIDSTSYTNANKFDEDWGRNCLTGDALIVLVPRVPLEPGASYTVAVTVQGRSHPYPNWPNSSGTWAAFAGQTRTYTWSFSVGR